MKKFVSFHRAMPETVAFLKDQMGALPFPFLNRVGLNSRPNGYAMFFGKLKMKF